MNIFKIADKISNEELVTILTKGKDIRVERIVSQGETTPDGFWYDQNEDELVILVQGSAIIQFEDNDLKLKAGDAFLIPAHKKHRVIYTEANPYTIWICIYAKALS